MDEVISISDEVLHIDSLSTGDLERARMEEGAPTEGFLDIRTLYEHESMTDTVDTVDLIHPSGEALTCRLWVFSEPVIRENGLFDDSMDESSRTALIRYHTHRHLESIALEDLMPHTMGDLVTSTEKKCVFLREEVIGLEYVSHTHSRTVSDTLLEIFCIVIESIS